MQELAEKVQEVVEPLRDQLDAVVVFPSMPEVMRLNKVGSFTMQNLGQSKSVVSDFMKKKKKVRGDYFPQEFCVKIAVMSRMPAVLTGCIHGRTPRRKLPRRAANLE